MFKYLGLDTSTKPATAVIIIGTGEQKKMSLSQLQMLAVYSSADTSELVAATTELQAYLYHHEFINELNYFDQQHDKGTLNKQLEMTGVIR